jgi:2-oxoglutarate ferredoxin oxidoreductase subunit gamma
MSKTLITGVAGQGVLLAGEIFAAAKIKTGGHGLKTATYTSQVRGGPTIVDPNLITPTNEDRKMWNIHEIPIITIANTMMDAIDKDALIATMLSKVHDVNKVAYVLGEKYANKALAEA